MPHCGVTRLAEITRLDTIGLPVWQAIRPCGRALSVHQGKGASDLEAKVGALCEAAESHAAENVRADGPVARFSALSPSERAPSLADYARDRDAPEPDEAVSWCVAQDVASDRTFHLPHDLVSLDLTAQGGDWFERSSTGLGAGPDVERSRRTALLELVERDAVGEWERAPLVERMASSLDPEEIGLDWFQEVRDRLRAFGIELRLFVAEPAIPVTVLICWMEADDRFGRGRRSFGGSAADGDPAAALFRAVAEAIQSRLTFIAAVRDDMLPSLYEQRDAAGPSVPAAPPGFPQRHWDELSYDPAEWRDIVVALCRAGFPQVAVKEIGGGLDGIEVTKAFVPGLGSLTRTRRW
jgi:ribosomal protein S12 methylthiotransferase accessory factor